MANPRRITADDMQIAGRNIAAQQGITVDELKAIVRNPLRDCAGPGCERKFTVHHDREKYCSRTCKTAANSLRNRADQ
ncbi:hypothetical protein ACFS27_03245 [Promicromonospora vindobonensis]|uniref:CGNR zinc finger protein n=1 Tax=Promicromonospora vindobonensis TaxID=195748 RepID=A0ABW5VML3_9MICO